MYVYVISPSESGPVKIGRGNDPKKRRASLQTGNPDSLEIYHSEPVGYLAEAVEREAHRVLASTRVPKGGKEWFDITPAEALIVVRLVARDFEKIFDNSKTLLEIAWFRPMLHEQYKNYCSDNDLEWANNLENIDSSCGLRLLAGRVAPPTLPHPSFVDFLMSYEDGMLMRWAFERMGERMPRDNKLELFYLAANYLEKQGIRDHHDSFYRFKDPAIRWFEWSTARDLTTVEMDSLLTIWNQFVQTHNSTIAKGLKWPNPILAKNADSVYVKILARDKDRGDTNLIMFASDHFRAIVTTSCYIDFTGDDASGLNFAVLDHKLKELKNVDLKGFVAVSITHDVWEQPFIPWLRSAPEKRDACFAKFLSAPESCFPTPYRCDGPRQPYVSCHSLPQIDAEGELR